MSDIDVVVNGTARSVPAGTTVADLVATVTDRTTGVAAARNDEVVTRHEWATTEVRAGDRVELLTAAQGG
jgi:sulfur carrier protein